MVYPIPLLLVESGEGVEEVCSSFVGLESTRGPGRGGEGAVW